MPRKTSLRGCFRFDREFPGVGRFWMSSGAKTLVEFRKRDALLSELYETGRLDVLQAILARRLTIAEVFSAQRTQRLSYLAADVLLGRPLWDELERWFPIAAAKVASRDRYQSSWNALLRVLEERFPGRVVDLATVPWAELQRRWGKSSADWNHLRRAVSRFLSMLLDDKWHPFRRLVLKHFPRAREPKARIPDLSPALFWRLVGLCPKPLQPVYVTLAVTGLRVRSEFLRLTDEDLLPHRHAIRAPAAKSAADTLIVDPVLWPWVQRAVPCPVGYKTLRRYWNAACRRLKVRGVTMHSLRHCTGQWAVNAGIAEAQVQAALRHETASTTRIYTLQKARGEVSKALAGVLLPRSLPRRRRTGT